MSKYSYPLLALAIAAHTQGVLAESQHNENHQDMGITVISAKRVEQKLEDVIGSVSVMTAEDMEKQVITDMNQLFRYEPGVQVTGSVGGSQNINIRGMSGNRVLIIKDGMRMNEGYGANGLNDIVGRGFIDTDTLKQVEVAKGASSSLYGSDALSGIVVFTTKDASDYLKDGETLAGSAKAGYSDNSKQASLGATLALRTGPVDHLLSVSGRKGEEQQNYKKDKQPFDIDSQSILYKTRLHLNDTDSIGFSADLWDQEVKGSRADGLLSYFRGLGQYGYRIASEGQTQNKKTRSFKLNYLSDADRFLYDHLNVSLYLNTNQQKENESGFLDINAPMFGTVEQRDMQQKALYKQRTKGFLSSATKRLNNMHELGYGLDIESTQSQRSVNEKRVVLGNPGSPNNRDIHTNKFPKNDIKRYGLYVNDTISLLDGRWQIIPGARFDRYEMNPNGATQTDGTAFKSIKKDNISFNLGTLYELSPELTMYAQYGQGFKVPAYDLAYIEHDLQPTSNYRYTIVPNGDLSPEKSHTYEIGLRGQTGNLSYNTAVFYNKYKDFLETALISSTTTGTVVHDIFHYQNIDSVTIKGIEAGIKYDLSQTLSVYGNASWQDGKDDKTSDYIRTISPLSGIVGLGYQDGSWNSDLILNWAKRMNKVNSGEIKTPGHATLDWQVGYNFKDTVKVNLAAFNLLDKKYIKHTSAAGHAESSNLTSLQEAGRTFNASVSYHF